MAHPIELDYVDSLVVTAPIPYGPIRPLCIFVNECLSDRSLQ